MNPITSNRRSDDLTPLELDGTLDDPRAAAQEPARSSSRNDPLSDAPIAEPLANPELLLPTRHEREATNASRSVATWAVPLAVLAALVVLAFVALRPHRVDGVGVPGNEVQTPPNTAPVDKKP